MASRPCTLLLAVLCTLPAGAATDPLDTVRGFFSGSDSLSADFHQEVTDSTGQVQQVSDGKLWIQRPGRFRWNYETPYRQELVADGEYLWSYDADLEQVTVQPMDKVFGATPAMLLGGSEPLDEVFRVEAQPADGDTLHAVLTPRRDDSNVTAIHVWFENGLLTRLEAIDSLGNHTRFTFTHLVRNAEIDAGRFRFEPPEGTDVIGDPR